ncbi:alpha/beta hydrolase [Rhizobium sp.]|jgi:pimeloyl-ACP methyl ester carboxylesterase|uniref:alpha/beta fold hydrolase n=1 Tax=Rhizobium sp. TaxID=391 RepID=UPI000E86BE6A|nr:alpha/beta hydrolase [Rhizobium sp.]
MKHVEVLKDGSRIGYVELPGKDPVRIFLHGLGSSSLAYFTAVAFDPLLAGQRTLLIDLLGFGISDRPHDFSYTLTDQAAALARLMEQLNLSNADVIAHSMGGSIAIMLASMRPDLVRRLVVCEPNLLPTPRPRVEPYSEERYVAEGFAKALATTGNIWPVTMRMADPVALYRSEHSLGKNMPDNLTDRLLDLPMPCSIVRGAHSSTLPCEDQINAANIPIITIAEAGHNMMLENYGQFIATLSHIMKI